MGENNANENSSDSALAGDHDNRGYKQVSARLSEYATK